MNDIVLWSAQTANAANAIPYLSGVCAAGQINLTHASNANIDQTFSYAVLDTTLGNAGTFKLNANSNTTNVILLGATTTNVIWSAQTQDAANQMPYLSGMNTLYPFFGLDIENSIFSGLDVGSMV